MTRRDLLRLLLASAVTEAVDVERLLWTPKPIITVPARGVNVYKFEFDWTLTKMSNEYLYRFSMDAYIADNVFPAVPSERATIF